MTNSEPKKTAAFYLKETTTAEVDRYAVQMGSKKGNLVDEILTDYFSNNPLTETNPNLKPEVKDLYLEAIDYLVEDLMAKQHRVYVPIDGEPPTSGEHHRTSPKVQGEFSQTITANLRNRYPDLHTYLIDTTYLIDQATQRYQQLKETPLTQANHDVELPWQQNKTNNKTELNDLQKLTTMGPPLPGQDTTPKEGDSQSFEL